MDVSIIVVSYCTRELTLACLESVRRETRDLEYEVLVVDNASDDGSAEAIAEGFPEFRLWALDENLGFAAANNLVAPEARGEYLLLLNPDTVVLDGAIQRLVAFARAHPERGIYGGRTLAPDGTLDLRSCWARITVWSTLCDALGLSSLFPRSPLLAPEAMPGWPRDSVREVDIVVGCFFLVRRAIWEELGGFDPAFFMYGEEADLCLRARAAGHRPTITPDATIIHHGGASERVPTEKQVRILRARARLAARHLGPVASRVVLALMRGKALLRAVVLWLASRVRPALRPRAATWAAAWRRRGEWSRF